MQGDLNEIGLFQIVVPRILTTAALRLVSVFEIALVRLSETSDYLHGQVNNPSAVIRQPSEKLQPDCTVPTSDQTPLRLIQIGTTRNVFRQFSQYDSRFSR